MLFLRVKRRSLFILKGWMGYQDLRSKTTRITWARKVVVSCDEQGGWEPRPDCPCSLRPCGDSQTLQVFLRWASRKEVGEPLGWWFGKSTLHDDKEYVLLYWLWFSVKGEWLLAVTGKYIFSMLKIIRKEFFSWIHSLPQLLFCFKFSDTYDFFSKRK